MAIRRNLLLSTLKIRTFPTRSAFANTVRTSARLFQDAWRAALYQASNSASACGCFRMNRFKPGLLITFTIRNVSKVITSMQAGRFAAFPGSVALHRLQITHTQSHYQDGYRGANLFSSDTIRRLRRSLTVSIWEGSSPRL